MDPAAVLERIQASVRTITETLAQPDALAHVVEFELDSLAEDAAALALWIHRGGFLPPRIGS